MYLSVWYTCTTIGWTCISVTVPLHIFHAHLHKHYQSKLYFNSPPCLFLRKKIKTFLKCKTDQQTMLSFPPKVAPNGSLCIFLTKNQTNLVFFKTNQLNSDQLKYSPNSNWVHDGGCLHIRLRNQTSIVHSKNPSNSQINCP